MEYSSNGNDKIWNWLQTDKIQKCLFGDNSSFHPENYSTYDWSSHWCKTFAPPLFQTGVRLPQGRRLNTVTMSDSHMRNSDEIIIGKKHPTLLMSFQSTIEALVDYTNPLLNSYRSFTHDAILIHGFIPENAATGTLKALFTISDGIRFVKNFDCRINWYFKWMGRMVRSMFEDMWSGNWSTKQNVFVWYSEIWWHFNRQQILQYSWMLVRLGKLWRL